MHCSSGFSVNIVYLVIIGSLVSIVKSGILSQEQINDAKTKEPLGTRDVITTGTDLRVKASRAGGSSLTYQFNANDGFKLDIGAGAWGTVQVSSFMTSRPELFMLESQFCTISGESTTHPLTSYLSFNNAKIVDYEVNDDLVFLLSSNKLVICVKITAVQDTILSTQWLSSGLVSLIGDVFTGDAQNVGLGFDKSTGYLYIPSLNGLFRINQQTQAVSKVADGDK